jgi:K+-sensing histidine kinase KdpD
MGYSNMVINNEKNWCACPVVWRYLICLVILTLIIYIQSSVVPSLGSLYPYAIFRLTSVFVAYFLGFGPAVFTLLIGATFGNLLFVEPYGEFTFPTLKDFSDFIVLILSTALIIALIERMQRNYYKSKLLLLVFNSRYEMLLHRENQKLHLERELKKIKT